MALKRAERWEIPRIPLEYWPAFAAEMARIKAEEEVKRLRARERRYKRTTWVGPLPQSLAAILEAARASKPSQAA